MLILDTTSKSLEIVLGAAPTVELPWVAAYADITSTTFVAGNTNGATSGTTPVTVVTAPAASTQRQLKFLSVINISAAQVIVQIQVNNGSTRYPIGVFALDVGDSLFYIDSEGFSVFTESGATKTSASAGALTPADHESVRHLIHFIEHGPAQGFASGAYRETTGTVFSSAIIWYDSSGIGKKKIVEKLITWSGPFPTTIAWKLYDASEVLLASVSDAISYSGPFETGRTRTIS